MGLLVRFRPDSKQTDKLYVIFWHRSPLRNLETTSTNKKTFNSAVAIVQ